jgi:hypothetical protein
MYRTIHFRGFNTIIPFKIHFTKETKSFVTVLSWFCHDKTSVSRAFCHDKTMTKP